MVHLLTNPSFLPASIKVETYMGQTFEASWHTCDYRSTTPFCTYQGTVSGAALASVSHALPRRDNSDCGR